MPLLGPPLKRTIRLTDLLQRGLDAQADEPALVSAVDRWTWRELDRASTRLACNLLALGLRPGDRVASLMPNCTALGVYYLAAIKAGLAATPLNYRYQAPEIDHALEVSGASLLVAHVERKADLAASKLAGRLSLGTLWHGGGSSNAASLMSLVEREGTPDALAPVDPQTLAFVFFTSGSTGKPKGVTHTHETMGWMLSSIVQGWEFCSGDIYLTASSVSHVGGVALSFSALAAGARVVLARSFDGDEILPLLRRERPTVMWMLPAALVALARDHHATHDDFRSLRLVSSGGDKVPAELEREFTDLAGFPIDEGYGMTEIGCATINPPSGVNKLGSIGPLCPGYALSIRDDETGQELPAGEAGRLWIRSPANMIGYWNRPDATAETIRDGWLDTGDVMRVDADGYLWFAGRKKQIIVHDGSNICPQEVEAALLEHPSVQSAAVVGVHDLVHGENVRAYITLRAGATRPTSQELIQFARARVGYKAPEVIEVLDELPMNATGKVDRPALKQLAEASVHRGHAA